MSGGPRTSRWVVTGRGGQLGRAMVAELREAEGCEVLAALQHEELDVSDPRDVKQFFEALHPRPDFVMNAAAFTHVDRCEREPDTAYRVNAVAPGLLAEACRGAGARLIQMSTDYVFAGDAGEPYTEEAPTAPLSAYGRSKLEGELRVRAATDDFLVVRTSWLFGDGRNFVAAILDQARARREGSDPAPLRVVDDQLGRPTYAVDLAAGIRRLALSGARGVFHLANDGVATWWEVARRALDACGYADLDIERAHTDQLPLTAPRPRFSVLDCAKAAALGVTLRDWCDALVAYLRSDASPCGEPAVR